MSPQTVESLINDLQKWWQLDQHLEVTLEANPNSVDAHKFKDFKQTGVNRLSLGIQSLDDHALRFLGRSHGRREALKALEITAHTFDAFSFDLIYARPQQTLPAWKRELAEALTYARDHLSLYQLTIEPGTAFQVAFSRGDWQLPQDEDAVRLYEITTDILSQRGYEAYEISNYAKAGHECRHNLTYWQYEDFVGIGPGAHGRLTLGDKRYAIKCLRAPETWLKSVNEHGHGIETREGLDLTTQLEEMILMGLRLREGIPYSRFEAMTGLPLSKIVDWSRINSLRDDNLLELTDSHVKATPQGRLVLNYVIERISKAIFSTVAQHPSFSHSVIASPRSGRGDP
jgi:putative oxygen-independent coproporphyrinogen III oxidase